MKKIKLKLTLGKIKFISFILSLLFISTFSWLTFLNYRDYSEFSAQVKEKEARVLELERDADNLNLLIADYRREKEEFEKSLFSDRDIATFLEEFSEFANKANTNITDMRVQGMQHVRTERDNTKGAEQNEEVDLSLYSIPIRVAAEGNFEHIVNFLIFLESYRQLLTISDVRIGNRAYPALNCSFLLRLYSLKQLSQIGAKN